MIDQLVNGFDEEVFCKFLQSKFSSFSVQRGSLRTKKDFAFESTEQLGIVKNLAGPGGLNMPLVVVAAKLNTGEVLKERSSRIRQFKFARDVLDQVMSNPAPGIEGVITQGLFVFYDDQGNFRLSLVYGKAEGTKLVWSAVKRLSFHVEVGAGNRTFRDRMALPLSSFDKLKEAFSVEKLTKEFYNRLFKWYQWALSEDVRVTYPNDIETDADDREIADHIIRLITRLIFVWFLKQKRLVPKELFDTNELKGILKNFNPVSGDNYYRAILQNLFFATLNSEIQERAFAVDAGNVKQNKEHFDIKTLYRYGKEFAISQEEVLELFKIIPFLNGGLFECLDREKNYYDGFSRNPDEQAQVPNILFFDEADGLIPLLNQYNFTVEENSPGDEEVALDPELLGKVFENLLGAYNPETKVAARNATGSFYTPREIVNYMVDESLIAHLTGKCGEDCEETIRALFSEGELPKDEKLCKNLDDALVTAKILDPACGSGAFPMGVLLRMVEILRILRGIPENESVYDLKLQLIENCIYGSDIQCIAVQISKLRFFISLVCEQKPTNNAKKNYGINSLPNLETKFVAADSLIGLPKEGKDVLELCTGDIAELKDQLFKVRHQHFSAKTYQEKKKLRREDKKLRDSIKRTVRHDAKPDSKHLEMLEQELEKVAEPKWVSEKPAQKTGEMFSEFASKAAQTEFKIDANEKPRKALEAEIAREHKKEHVASTEIDSIADMLASWDPYDQNAISSFLDPEWMFNVKNGFDVVLGNPPYIHSRSGLLSRKIKDYCIKNYTTVQYQLNTFVVFIERGVSFLCHKGVLSYIIPNYWLSTDNDSKLRKFLFKDNWVREILNVYRVFEAATVDTLIISVIKTSQLKQKKTIVRSIDPSVGLVPGQLESVFTNHLWQYEYDYFVDNRVNDVEISFKPKVSVKSNLKMGDIFDFKFGIKLYELGKGSPPQTKQDIANRVYSCDKCKDKSYSQLIGAGNVNRYMISGNKTWIKYGEHLAAPRSPLLFSGPRILLRRIVGEQLDAAFCDQWLPSNTDVIVLKPKNDSKINILYYLGLLCSSTCSHLVKAKNVNLDRQAFPKVNTATLESLPLPVVDMDKQVIVASFVERIMLAKKADPTADTTALEAEIDQLVYKLYDLTPEEIAIVEGSLDKQGGAGIPACEKGAEGQQAGMPASPSKKRVSRKRKTNLPPSLPGWD